MKPVVVISADKEIIELAKEFTDLDILGVLDPKLDADALGLPILGTDDDWPAVVLKYPELKVILAVDAPSKREKLVFHYGVERLVTLISPDSYVSPSVEIGHGCLIQRGVKVMSNAKLKTACKINVNSTIHHDAVIGDFCTLAPGSQLLGAVVVENKVFIGAGAVILPKVKIGENAIVGAGAVVVSDVAARTTVAGVPARLLRDNT